MSNDTMIVIILSYHLFLNHAGAPPAIVNGPVVHCLLYSSSVLLRGLCATNVMSK